MLIVQLLQQPGAVLSLVTVLVVGLTVHEYSHAWSAFHLGDPTAMMRGRLTLDPRAHIDPMGALVFLLVGFGWAKPVPIDGYRLGRTGTLWVSLAGPVSNFALALAALLPLRILSGSLGGALPDYVAQFLFYFGFLNLMLGLFNLIPVAPLDGWKVLLGLVPPNTAWRIQQYERYGPMILIVLIFAGRVLPVDPLSALFTGTFYLARLIGGG
jgi:Zn-dependent protease